MIVKTLMIKMIMLQLPKRARMVMGIGRQPKVQRNPFGVAALAKAEEGRRAALTSQLPKVRPKVRVDLKEAEEDQKPLQVELAEASLKRLLKRSLPLKRPKPKFRTFLMLRVMKFK